jgi:hypothetical protein
MARPATPLPERVERLSHRDGACLIWKGQMRRGRPHLDRIGNPVRVLLNLTDQPRIQVRPTCHNERCIEPFHWRVNKENDHKYQDLPDIQWTDPRLAVNSKFTAKEMVEIEENLELLINNEVELEDLDGLPLHIKEEILRRANPKT